jgi:ribonuclease BN (tRNA processing enzyme)
MKLTVLGCAGSFPSAQSPASSYLLEHDGHRIVLDLGSGALGALQRHADPYDLDAAVLSHLHPDHCADLTGLYVMRRYRPTGAAPTLPVYGPVETADRFAKMYGPREPDAADFAFTEHTDAYRIGPFEVRTTRVVHPVTAYAVRVSAGGRTVVYSGDTGECDGLVELSRGADLALYEASFVGSDNPPGIHLTGRQAAQHATRAGVGRLVLTHLVAWHDPALVEGEAAAAYDGDLSVAAPGTSYEV